MKIEGENYSPASYKVYIAQFLSTFKMIVIGFILFGQNPFTYLNMATPNFFTWALENKLYATLMTFFLSNAIETHLITTGAFEVYLNGNIYNLILKIESLKNLPKTILITKYFLFYQNRHSNLVQTAERSIPARERAFANT